MKAICFYLFLGVLACVPLHLGAQNIYFYNQKNLISFRVSMNPRLLASKQDTKSIENMEDGTLGRGTYYQYYDENNELVSGNQKINLMLNASYGRLFGGNKLIGVEFNYQKHHLTWNENANVVNIDEFGASTTTPLLISNPVFDIFDVQLLYGHFLSGSIAPNKHLFTYGAGVRIISLDQNQNYRKDSQTPYTDLSKFVEGYDSPMVYARVSMNYTYRILLTKNLSLDLGANLNVGLYMNMDHGESYTVGSSYNGVAFDRYYVKSKLAAETFYNMLYLRAGLSFAI